MKKKRNGTVSEEVEPLIGSPWSDTCPVTSLYCIVDPTRTFPTHSVILFTL